MSQTATEARASIEGGKSQFKSERREIVETVRDHAERLCSSVSRIEDVVSELKAKLDQFHKIPNDEESTPKTDHPSSPNGMLEYGNGRLENLLGQLEEQVKRL